MLDITGAGTQHLMRSHWKLRPPGPQSHKNSKQQCKRYRANTVTANSKASATRQTAQQPQPAPLFHRRNSYREGPAASKSPDRCQSPDRVDPEEARRAASQDTENPPHQLCRHPSLSSPGSALRPDGRTNSPFYVRAPPPPWGGGVVGPFCGAEGSSAFRNH